MYGSETWVLREQGQKRTEASRVSFLRSTLGATMGVGIRNKGTRKRLGTENIAECPGTGFVGQ
jgi:hypothetical protein